MCFVNLGKTGAMNKPQRLSIYFNVHLVSDSTGETLNAVQRAACAQFENVQPLEHNYYLVRSERQLERAMLPVLDASVAMLGRHLGISANQKVAGQHALDDDYFERMEAINFTLAHDDGQNVDGLVGADVILLGVSRTSKTPTCVYLANRKVKAGNIPLVPGVPLPAHIEKIDGNGPLIVGLKISAERLVQIRRQRLISLQETKHTIYADEAAVREEVTQANRLFQRNQWKTIDVSRRSVEETAAAILNLLNERKGQA